MRQWGSKYAAPYGPPLQMMRKGCGKISHAVMTCSGCGERLTAKDVRAVRGRGDLDNLMDVGGRSF